MATIKEILDELDELLPESKDESETIRDSLDNTKTKQNIEISEDTLKEQLDRVAKGGCVANRTNSQSTCYSS